MNRVESHSSWRCRRSRAGRRHRPERCRSSNRGVDVAARSSSGRPGRPAGVRVGPQTVHEAGGPELAVLMLVLGAAAVVEHGGGITEVDGRLLLRRTRPMRSSRRGRSRSSGGISSVEGELDLHVVPETRSMSAGRHPGGRTRHHAVDGVVGGRGGDGHPVRREQTVGVLDGSPGRRRRAVEVDEDRPEPASGAARPAGRAGAGGEHEQGGQ